MPTWSGLQIRLPKAGLTFLHLFIFPLGLNFDGQFFSNFHFYSSGLTLDCQFFKFLFFHLDSPLIASLSNFHFFIFFFYLPGLTSKCQFDCALTLSLMLTWLDLHLWCQTCWDSRLFESPWFWLNYLLSSEGLSKAFIGCETLFHSTSLFQMSKQISDAICHATYDCAWMKCPSIFWILFFSFFILMNVKYKCHMQMPLLVLPMRYATIVP